MPETVARDDTPADTRQEQNSPNTATSNFVIESFRIIIVAAII